MRRHTISGCVFVLTPLLCAAQSETPAAIQIRVLEGGGAINSIRLHRGHDPVAQVVDPSGKPVTGATVTFLLPATGPGGVFQDSGLSFTARTDDKGIAAAHGMKPNRLPGSFHIRVVASWRGEAANALVAQTNADPVAPSHARKKIVILALIAAGVAGGAAAAAAGGGGSSAPAGGATGSAPAGTIVAGSPTLGPPR